MLEWLGYAASGIIALSMTMNSIVRFRWINFVGALSFSIYGFLIGAIPVGLLNGFIVSIDVYYLTKFYARKDFFDLLEIRKDNKYLLKFLAFYDKDIHTYYPRFQHHPEMNTLSFFILRNTAVAGIFLAHAEDETTLRVGLDYVVPTYRDLKNGRFIYQQLNDRFIEAGFEQITTLSDNAKHSKYLKKLGFVKNAEGVFIKNIVE